MIAINKKTALVQVMAWRRTGDKPLPVPMTIPFTDAYYGTTAVLGGVELMGHYHALQLFYAA